MGENYKFKIIMLGDFGVGKTSRAIARVMDVFMSVSSIREGLILHQARALTVARAW